MAKARIEAPIMSDIHEGAMTTSQTLVYTQHVGLAIQYIN